MTTPEEEARAASHAARKEHLRYRVWLHQHSPEYKPRNQSRDTGYFDRYNERERLCDECRAVFVTTSPYRKKCDNCNTASIDRLDMYFQREELATTLDSVMNASALPAAEAYTPYVNDIVGLKNRGQYKPKTYAEECAAQRAEHEKNRRRYKKVAQTANQDKQAEGGQP